MTEHQTMNTVVHAAFRRDLARFARAFDAFPAGSKNRAAALGLAWDNFVHQLHVHHHHEETIFWPAMVQLGVDPSLMAALDGEHQQMSAALDAADASVSVFRDDPTSARAAEAGAAVRACGDVVTSHLAHEERDLEPWMAERQASAPMKVASAQVRKASKGEAGDFFAWLLDGADADAEAALRQQIPPPVLFVLSRVGGRGYRKNIAPVWS